MKNKQKGFIGIILVILLALAAVGGGGYIYVQNKNHSDDSKTDISKTSNTELKTASTTESGIKVSTKVAPSVPPVVKTETKVEVKSGAQAQVSTSDPWTIIDAYKTYIKNRDLKGVNNISYNPDYEDPKCPSKEECDMLFEFLLKDAEDLNKNNYKNKWEDNKQIILTTDVKKSLDTYKQGTIMFVKDSNGNLKLLFMTDTSRNSIDGFTDSDQDGLNDDTEKCENGPKYLKSCSNTDWQKRDTNGNGWWDGVEAKLY